ncbi:MAG: CARDB domain-containing protein [Planctomycetota bacterium]
MNLPLPSLPAETARTSAGEASKTADATTNGVNAPALPALPTPALPELPNVDTKTEVAQTTPTLPSVGETSTASPAPAARKMPPVRTRALPPQESATNVASSPATGQRVQTPVQPGNQQVAASRSLPAASALAPGMAARFDDPSFGYSQTPGPNERLRMQSPHIRVILNGPSNIAVGAVGDYEVVVQNQDQIQLNGLLLRLEVPQGVGIQPVQPESGEVEIERAPDGATLMTWGIEQLNPGDVVRAPVKMVANSASDFAIGLEWTLVPITNKASVHVISPQLQLAIDGKSEVLYGESNVYRLRLKNVGEATAKSVQVKVQAEQYGASATEIGDIAPGAEELLEVELEFEQSGPIELSATAVAKNKVSTLANQQVMVRQPVLIAELAAPGTVYHGNDVAYAVRIRNTGDAASREEIAYLRLPKAARPVALPYGAQHDGSTLAWKVKPLAAGEERVFQFQLALPGEGDNKVVLECGNQLGSPVRTEAHTIVQAIADLKLIVSDPVAPAPLGTEVVYELNLTNRGSKAAHNVSVVAQFSKGIEPTRSSGHGYRVVPGQVFFDPISTVGPGESVKLMVYAVAEAAGMHRFRAEVRSSDEDIRLVQEESTRYLDSATTRVAAPPASSPLR